MENELIATFLFLLLGTVLIGVIVSGIMLLKEFYKYLDLNRKYKELEKEENLKKIREDKLNLITHVN